MSRLVFDPKLGILLDGVPWQVGPGTEAEHEVDPSRVDVATAWALGRGGHRTDAHDPSRALAYSLRQYPNAVAQLARASVGVDGRWAVDPLTLRGILGILAPDLKTVQSAICGRISTYRETASDREYEASVARMRGGSGTPLDAEYVGNPHAAEHVLSEPAAHVFDCLLFPSRGKWLEELEPLITREAADALVRLIAHLAKGIRP